ncbi:PD-(D/E)XK nuclease family protein [Branchiibius sp. NY16-3462-2]|uniref:PD-(D/E)XK nuclease family protein n=1 Tax=Branchiibius sp. NY16-3462-2 TaxID=1807500 RepID=UPI0007972CFF|nr:PD-(D/E)XK nuclease family protein [Branchiibius sp. NY16-3462-2]KYH45431.1 hypothetical protein AZH51_01900 [Branchiibius sp. NY16-3462-2]
MGAQRSGTPDVGQALVTSLLPLLARSEEAGFNVFDVMRHGSHEKQLSNVFAWLFDERGTHGLEDRFLRIFLAEVNQGLPPENQFVAQSYAVWQERNTSAEHEALDIADIVLENDSERVVIENFYTSDGHGHRYDGYLSFARGGGRAGVVVLLCQSHDIARQADGWEHAIVVTYATLVNRLLQLVGEDRTYTERHSEAYSFIAQMYRKFVKNRGPMEDHELLSFVAAMCATGAAERYAWNPQETAATTFAAEVAAQAEESFVEGRQLLQRLKGRLRSYCGGPLKTQLNDTLGAGFIRGVNSNYRGSYQWTINFDVDDEGESFGETRLQVKFGPSALHANQKDPEWKQTVADPDYSHLFLTRARYRQVRQSAVTLQDVLDGLAPDDRRLHDEIVDLWMNPRQVR